MASSLQPVSRDDSRKDGGRGDRFDRELSLYHLLDPGVVANPYPLFRRLREEDPVHWDPFLHAWVVTRYPDVLEVLHTFSADRTPSAEQLDTMGLARLGPIARVMVKQMLFMDAPAHTRLRGLAQRAFMPARVELLRSHIQDIVNRLLDDVQNKVQAKASQNPSYSGGMEVIADLAEPLPAIVTAEMLGVPVGDRHQLKQWSANFAEMLGNFQHNPDHAPLMLRTVDEMAAYFRDMIQEIKAHPREGLIHSLLTAEIDGDRLTEEEVVANTIVTMVGGQETTTNLIGNGLLTMLQHPEEMQRLRNDLSLIPSAVEEMLRYESPSQHTARLAPEDRELGGKKIQKRQAVIAVMAAANRDPERFPEPNRFDITRQDNRHLAFGYAAHFCFGAPLARAEGQVAFEALLRRFPKLRLEPQQLQWRTNSGLRGLNSLKVSFDDGVSAPGSASGANHNSAASNDKNSAKNASVPEVEGARAANPTARLSENKPSVAKLSDAKRSAIENYLKSGFARPRIPRRSDAAPVPLSCAQEQIWLHTQLAPDVPMYNEAVIIDRKGPLDVASLERSLSEIVRRHEAWRTNFELVDGQPVQVVREPEPVALPVVDLRHLSPVERELQARSLAEEQTRKPFDLKQDLLLRAKLLRLTDDDHQVILTLHHIVFDGLSIYDVFLPEFLTLYRGYSAGATAALPDLPIRYTDFAAWQKDRQLEGPLCQQMDYWRKQLSGDIPVLQLPTDRPRPAVQTYHGAMLAFRLPKSLSDSLRQASQREGSTVFMTLLAAFATLLHRYTGQDDFIVGTVSAGRKESELQGLLGCFQNPMALRVDLSGDPSFREMQKRARTAILGALSHDDVPFGTLVQELQAERDLSRSPILQVLLSLAPAMPDVDPGWDLKQMAVDVGAAKFDLDLELDDRPDGIRGRFVYNTDLFDAGTIARTVGHWETLLQSVVDHPEQSISTLPILTESEKQQLTDWNRTDKAYPKDKCIHRLVEAQAERTPAAIAVQQEKKVLSYAELNARANQLAHYLRKRGVGADVPVGICLQSSPGMMVALLGVLKAGAACVPLDPKYPHERLAYMIEDAQVPVLIADSRTAANFPGVAADLVNLTEDWAKIEQESAENPRVEVTPENLAYLIYTSGSTGKPRGVELTHRGLVNHNLAAIELYGLRPEDCVLQFSSISFDIAVEEIFPAWISGARLVLKTEDMPLTAGDFLRWIRALKITVLDLPTAYWHELVHQLSESHQALPEKLRLVIVGGEKASPVSLAAWKRLAGERVRWVNTYGPTEASVIATAYEPGAEIPALLPIGRPIANTQIHILNSSLQPQPVGIRGELHIGGRGVARGYLNRPEMTAAKFIADPFSTAEPALLYKTGDMARYLPDGNIEFLGRTDDQVKVRGFRVELGEIEALLAQVPGIDMAVVAAREDGRGEKNLVAYFVPAKEPSPTGSELRGFLKERLPEHMLPSSFVKLEHMPLTPNGKVDRRALPEPSAADSAAAENLTAPKDALESQLVSIWQSILGKQPIGVRQSFFDLGGHSLLAVRLMHRLEQVFGKKMPITTLFQAPTIEHMAELLRTKGWAPSWSSLVPIQPLGSKPPFFCVHGAGGTVIIYRDLARHLGPDQPMYGLQAQGLDGTQTCLTRVEDMAAHYLQAIRTIQPAGPYILGGLSFGGTVAFEMARQLQARGEEVALLALFDTFPGRYEAATLLLMKLGRMRARDQFDYVRRKTGQYARNWKRRIDRMFLPEALKKVRRGIHEAGTQYAPQPYAGAVTLFRASEKSLRGVHDSDAGWTDLARGGLEIFEIPGGHVSILAEPQVKVLAEHLAACIEKAHTDRLVPQLCER